MKTEITKKNLPLVSVCMITYNHAAYIEKALDGIFMQSGPFDLELIISDDCSSDETNKIIERKIRQINNITLKYFPQKKNLGIIENFVFALNHCSGKYISICEGDDFWLDEKKLEKQISLLEAEKNLVGSFHYVKVQFEGKPYLSNIYCKEVPKILCTDDLIAKRSLIHTSSLFFRREAMIFPDWYTSFLSGDYALSSILSKSGCFKRIDEVMSVYRVHEFGVTNTREYNINNRNLKVQILRKLNKFHDYKYNDKFEKVISELLNPPKKLNLFKKLRRKIKFGLIIRKAKYTFSKLF